MPQPNDRADAARRLLERCGLDSSCSDEEAIGRADAVLAAAHEYEGRDEDALARVVDAHMEAEFVARDIEATMATMTDDPYLDHVPVMTGGYGRDEVRDFYSTHFIPVWPEDTEVERISRTIGRDSIVEEVIIRFTHDRVMDFLLPGVPPTGRRVELPHAVVVGCKDGLVAHEHIYWDQASALVQTGLLEPDGLPVTGAEQARKLRDPSRPSNTLIPERD